MSIWIHNLLAVLFRDCIYLWKDKLYTSDDHSRILEK